jgi:DNA topoisomerase-1
LAAVPLALATAPLPRFDEAGLLAELEARGIGRPSTFAATLEAILEKGYVEKVERDYRPTALGTRVTEVLCAAFPRELEVDFTAAVEAQIDAVEVGTAGWQEVVAGFHAGFGEELRRAGAEPDAAAPGIACRRCGRPMALRLGRRGEFLACTGWPACPESMDFRREGDRVVPLGPEAAAQGQRCPACGAPLLARRGRFGSFLACSRAPACRAAVPLPTGVPCPRGCGGQVALRRNQRGRSYYGCSSYPRCDFVSWDRPCAEPCPQCGGPFLVDRFSRGEGATVACPDRRCGYRRVAPLEPSPGAGQGGPAVPPSSSGPPGGGKMPDLA